MLYSERQIVPRPWRRQLFLLCILLALVVSANATALDKRSKRTQRQELSLEDRLYAERRLSSLVDLIEQVGHLGTPVAEAAQQCQGDDRCEKVQQVARDRGVEEGQLMELVLDTLSLQWVILG